MVEKVTIPKGARFVTVASKLPMSIEIRLCKKIEKKVPGRYGSETEIVFEPHGKMYRIRGTAEPAGQAPKGYIRPIKSHGFAITRQIPADFFEAWLEQNATTDMVANQHIWAHSVEEDVAAFTKANEKERTFLEPLDPDDLANDPRVPKSQNPDLQDVAPDRDSMAARGG
jgi:hypothetical protein